MAKIQLGRKKLTGKDKLLILFDVFQRMLATLFTLFGVMAFSKGDAAKGAFWLAFANLTLLGWFIRKFM